MKMAILFWFYKEPEVCEDRLILLKKHNPDAVIYGLFGGTVAEEGLYKEKLGNYLDDFYTFTETEDSHWKWIHGDLVLLDWYEKRGKSLTWDSMVVVQWDMLVFNSLQKQFADMKKGEIFFSGLRNLDKEIEDVWYWTTPTGKERPTYLKFLAEVKEKYNYTDTPPICCLYILVVLPRIFFDKYLEVENKELGMLEYKDPIYAKIFDIPFFIKDVGVEWHDGIDKKPLNAIPQEIEVEYIKEELAKEDGYRIFHPYFKIWE